MRTSSINLRDYHGSKIENVGVDVTKHKLNLTNNTPSVR